MWLGDTGGSVACQARLIRRPAFLDLVVSSHATRLKISMRPLRQCLLTERLLQPRRSYRPILFERFFSPGHRLFYPGVKKRPLTGPKKLPLPPADLSSDHRELGTKLSLFTGHPSSPGSPFFYPDGAHVFQKLQSFLRAQYPSFGFREVITPNLYKQSLWEQSGHWENYKEAMFSVVGKTASEGNEDPNYSLKPMNCPGHCLLYKSQKHSFRDLPIRYADFSPLHRDELSGALSGLTRVRRFHQDDGHIFCRPNQVEEEIRSTLQFVDMAYQALKIPSFRLVLSTRPEKDYLGSPEQWEEAEIQLEKVLNDRGREWERNPGDGAFYGPKIDIILKDADGKEHQTATIQLDFQLPQRFGLNYDTSVKNKGTPVLIHRAIFGSLERFLALLIEQYRGHWPFWMSPRQMIILSIGEDEHILQYARKTAQQLANSVVNTVGPRSLNAVSYMVDMDLRNETVAKKIVDAKAKKYNLICFIGKRNVREGDLDIDITGQPRQEEAIKVFEQVRPGTISPVQQVLAKKIRRGILGVKVRPNELQRAMRIMCDRYL